MRIDGRDALDLSGYRVQDVERFVHEQAKNPQRTPFERDRARVLHSSALRRLGAKTQVLGPAADDFVRTRLTHSLEVAQVGRALGQALGCDPDVVDTACLSHDLGHPPYGHNGEKALDVVARQIGGFEGNAQTFRILTRLEPKTLDEAGRPVGVNLTRAWYGTDLSADALGAAFERLAGRPYWIRSYNGSVADAAHLKNLTSEIIGRFVSAVASASRQTYGDGPLTRYEAELVIPEETAAEILLLKGIAVRYVMEPREHEPVYLRQRTLIFDLADVLMTGGGKGIDPVLLDVWHRAENDDARLRVVVDQIASLTDTSARAWHARLCGMFSEV